MTEALAGDEQPFKNFVRELRTAPTPWHFGELGHDNDFEPDPTTRCRVILLGKGRNIHPQLWRRLRTTQGHLRWVCDSTTGNHQRQIDVFMWQPQSAQTLADFHVNGLENGLKENTP